MGNASGIPYFPGAAQVSFDGTGLYAAEHAEAIERWNTALPRDYILVWKSPPDPTQYMVLTGSDQDLFFKAYYFFREGGTVYSCQDIVDANPWLVGAGGVRAFMFGHTPGNGDKKYTVICLNHSAHTSCTICFDDYDVSSPETQIKGITHEMGHSLHLGHPLDPDANKGIMDQDWGTDIIPEEANYIHFAYAVGHNSHRVRQELELPGESAGYYECVTDTDWNDLNPGPVTMRAYCYVDVPGIPVNPGVGPASGDGLPGGPPPDPYGEVDDKHAVLGGLVQGPTGIVTVEGCFEDRDGDAPLGHVYVQWLWNTGTATGWANTWVDIQDVNDCLGGTPLGAPDSFGSLELADTSYEVGLDSDGDGCTDQQELSDSAASGGLRDPFNPYDFFDVDGDHSITIGDISGVASRYLLTEGEPGYGPEFDRGTALGSNAWNVDGPSGDTGIDDVGTVAAQFLHAC